MSKDVVIHCDRCGKQVDGLHDFSVGMTAGFYVVSPGSAWHRFARPNETYICDACMWSAPAYQAEYGVRQSGSRDIPS